MVSGVFGPGPAFSSQLPAWRKDGTENGTGSVEKNEHSPHLKKYLLQHEREECGTYQPGCCPGSEFQKAWGQVSYWVPKENPETSLPAKVLFVPTLTGPVAQAALYSSFQNAGAWTQGLSSSSGHSLGLQRFQWLFIN